MTTPGSEAPATPTPDGPDDEHRAAIFDPAWWREVLTARFAHADFLRLNAKWRAERVAEVAREIVLAVRLAAEVATPTSNGPDGEPR